MNKRKNKHEHNDIFCHDKYKCSCGFETTQESEYKKHKEEIEELRK